MKFTKATKEQAKLRAAIFGPSGAGKTYTALRIATGMSDKIAVIDTERGSASKYASNFDFDVLDLPDHDIDTYIKAITAAGNAGYEVLVIDSLTHGWKDLLQEIDKIARTKFGGNTWAAWSEGTPKQQAMINAILDFPGHVIASMRSKTEWTSEVNSRGRSQPVRVGLTPEAGKGIEYEFDLLLELSTNHAATVIKDRTGKYQDAVIEMPGEEFGASLIEWLSDGEAVVHPPTRDEVMARIKLWAGITSDGVAEEAKQAAQKVVAAADSTDPQELMDYIVANESKDFATHTEHKESTNA